jgi:hypothetical protein
MTLEEQAVQETLEWILEEEARVSTSYVQPGEITVRQFATREGIEYRAAGRRLDKLVDKGVLIRRIARDPETNKELNAYSKAEERKK